MFEAGAISRIDLTLVCPITFDIEATDIQGPLAQFQVTKFTKEDMANLFNTINSAAGNAKLSEFTVQAVFEKWWPDLDEEVRKIMTATKTLEDKGKVRSDRELVEETLQLARKTAAGPFAGKPQSEVTKKIIEKSERNQSIPPVDTDGKR